MKQAECSPAWQRLLRREAYTLGVGLTPERGCPAGIKGSRLGRHGGHRGHWTQPLSGAGGREEGLETGMRGLGMGGDERGFQLRHGLSEAGLLWSGIGHREVQAMAWWCLCPHSHVGTEAYFRINVAYDGWSTLENSKFLTKASKEHFQQPGSPQNPLL